MDTLGNRVAARGLRGVKTRVEQDGAAQTGVSIPVTAGRDLNVGDNGATLVPTGAMTLGVPDGLPDNFYCHISASAAGTTTIHRTGTATLNGATSDITRAQATAANTKFTVQKQGAAEVYTVTGV